MSYETSSIGALLGQINSWYFLPAIQRPYVWKPEQVIALFDSVLKGYPINSFLFWEVEADRRGELEIYKFIENFRQGDTHNEIFGASARDVQLVLDGQQRLTSLLIGLRGSYTMRAKHARKTNPDAWSRQRLWLDLMKDPEQTDEDETEIGVTYGFAFHEAPPRNSALHHWLRVSDIMVYEDPSRFRTMLDETLSALPRDASPRERAVVEANLRRLHAAVWGDDAIAFHVERNQSHDRVLDIFVRANDGGTKLSKSDLMLSLVTATWSDKQGREEVFGFADYINDGLDARNAIDKDFVLKACLVLEGFDVRYRVDNFTVANLRRMEGDWSEIKSAIERTLRFVNRLGFNRETLTSVNALLPVACWFFHRPGVDLMGTTPQERRIAGDIHRWLLQSMISGAFSGSSDRTIQQARAVLRDAPPPQDSFPTQELLRAMSTRGRSAAVTDRAIEDMLDLRYGERDRRQIFLALSLIHDRRDWGANGAHIDHIIPQSLANRKALMRMNLPESRIAAILAAVDRLGNLQLLIERENLEKSDMSFETWIETRDQSFLDAHLIPDRPDLWRVAMLPEFVQTREALIREQLKMVVGV